MLPVIPASDAPELPWSLDGLLTEQVLQRLQQDPLLQEALSSVESYETEGRLLSSTFSPPALGVVLAGKDEVRTGSNRSAVVTTLVALYLVTTNPNHAGTRSQFRSRVFEQAIRILEVDGGEFIVDGRPINCALVEYQQIPGAIPLADDSLVATRLVVVFRSKINQETRQWL